MWIWYVIVCMYVYECVCAYVCGMYGVVACQRKVKNYKKKLSAQFSKNALLTVSEFPQKKNENVNKN